MLRAMLLPRAGLRRIVKPVSGSSCSQKKIAPAASHNGTPACLCSTASATFATKKTNSAAPGSATPAAIAARLCRAEEIRRHEQRMRWVRALVIPAFTLYGLFILRPTEGHFLRYLAERRHLEPCFNALFPPPVRNGGAGDEAASDEARRAATDKKVGQAEWSRTTASAAASSGKVAVDSGEWVRKRFGAVTGEDAERLARRRLLFAREHNYTASLDDAGQVPIVVRSAEERRCDLEQRREHPPMHLLGEQLDRIAAASRAYRLARGAAATVAAMPPPAESDDSRDATKPSPLSVVSMSAPLPPPVTIDFTDHTFFATACVTLSDPSGEAVTVMRFVGACGMMWKQVT